MIDANADRRDGSDEEEGCAERPAVCDKVGRLFGLLVDATVAHSRAHCCEPDGKMHVHFPFPVGRVDRPGGPGGTGTVMKPGDTTAAEHADSKPTGAPTTQPDSSDQGGNIDVNCAVSWSDVPGQATFEYHAQQDYPYLRCAGVQHVRAGAPPTSHLLPVGFDPPAISAGDNDVIVVVDHGLEPLRYGLYFGLLQPEDHQGVKGDPEHLTIYVSGTQ